MLMTLLKMRRTTVTPTYLHQSGDRGADYEVVVHKGAEVLRVEDNSTNNTAMAEASPEGEKVHRPTISQKEG